MHFTGGEIIPRRVLCPWRARLLASTLPRGAVGGSGARGGVIIFALQVPLGVE